MFIETSVDAIIFLIFVDFIQVWRLDCQTDIITGIEIYMDHTKMALR